MTEYRVTYEIDVDASSPLAAARQAFAMMTSPESMLPILSVAGMETGTVTTVDLEEAQDTRYGHQFTTPTCKHWRCGEASGWQCAECGHYFPREAVRMDSDSEVRCRTGMGHERRGAYS